MVLTGGLTTEIEVESATQLALMLNRFHQMKHLIKANLFSSVFTCF